jgi:hypothetical protein
LEFLRIYSDQYRFIPWVKVSRNSKN